MFWRFIEGVVATGLAAVTPAQGMLPEEFIKNAASMAHLSPSQRLDYFAPYFVDQETPFGWLPETPIKVARDVSELMDQLMAPENRESFAGFDCMTYVETVLAMTQGVAFFAKNLESLRYTGRPCFLNRNHFLLDTWIAKNVDILRDVTGDLGICAQEAHCTLDYPGWLYNHDRVRGFRDAHPEFTREDLVKALQDRVVTTWGVRDNKTPYLKTQDVLTHWEDVEKNMPDQSIMVIVRPNWQIKDTVGTNMNESHLGFVLRRKGILMLHHATSRRKKVVMEPLKTYLEEIATSPTIGGIRVFALKLDKNL